MNPIITVAIVTYNSSKTVIETLDSIAKQTYKRIELVISDDASNDNTVEICSNWLQQNRNRFVNSVLVTSNTNTGVTDNCNRALAKATGEWFKVLAGDDLLVPNCIEEFYKCVTADNNIKAVFSDYISFVDYNNVNSYKRIKILPRKVFFSRNITAKQQSSIVTKIFVGFGPSFFIKTDILKLVGGYDSRFPMQEDHALYIKLTKSGYKLHLLEKPLIMYRVSNDSISHASSNNSIYNKCQIRYLKDYKYQYLLENSNVAWKLLIYMSMFLRNKVIDSGNSYKILSSRFYLFVERILSPLIWYDRVIRMFDKHNL